MKYFLACIMMLVVNFSYGQNFAYPSIKSKGQTIEDFIPVGWTVLDSSWGDLNKDGAKDAAIILQYKDSVFVMNREEDTVLTQPRVLIVLFHNLKDGNLDLAEQNNSFILKHDNIARDDPYQDLLINKGVLEFRFYFFYSIGSWYITNAAYKFRYQQGQFILIGAETSSIHRATHDYENYSYNFLTKKRAFTKGNEIKNIKKTTWKAINISSLKTLKTFEEPFSWEVENDVFL